MKPKTYTTEEAAKLLNVSQRRIQAMLEQDRNPNRRKTHFPNAQKQVKKIIYEWLIPEKDIKAKIKSNTQS